MNERKTLNLALAAAFLMLSAPAVAQEPPPAAPDSSVAAPPPPPPPPVPGSPSLSLPPGLAPASRPGFPAIPPTAPAGRAPALPPFGSSSIAPAETVREDKRAAEKTLKDSLRAKGLVNLDFVNADVADIAKSISELTKRNFILDDKAHGKVTIISPKPVTIEEAYQAFISALSVQGFTVIPAGRMLKIVPLRDMKNNPIPTDIDHPAGGDDAFVTRLIPVRHISAAEMVKAVRGLLTKNGDVINYDATNTLILTDAVGNIRRLLKIIDKLDRPGNLESLEIIRIKYASCIEVTQKIMTIFDLKGSPKGAVAAPGMPESLSAGGQFISKILPDERTNSIIVVASQEGLRRVKEVVDTIDQAIEKDAGKGSIHVHYLQYADSAELVGTLTSLVSGHGGSGGKRGSSASGGSFRSVFPTGAAPAPGAAPGAGGTASGTIEGTELFEGKIQLTADTATNALVIVASPADYKSLLPVLQKLDIRRPQAFVEAMILEVNIDKAFNIGTALHLGKQFQNGQSVIFGGSQFSGYSSLSLPTNAASSQGGIFGLQGRTIDIPIAGGEKLSIPVYGATFRALQTNGTINVLSTPTILTSDNKEAEIVVGQVVPFLVAQGRDINNQPINQIQRENVAITLRVTPQINESDDITMNIFQQIQDLVPGTDLNTLGPTTSNRSAKTTVLVKDSQTISIGGLIQDRESDSISKIPVLGDIPLLGWFFKSKFRSKAKTSLMIFITPHIIRTPEDMEAMSIQKNRERMNFLKENAVGDHPGIRKYKLERNLNAPPKKTPFARPVPADSPTGNFLPPPAPPEAAVKPEASAETPLPAFAPAPAQPTVPDLEVRGSEAPTDTYPPAFAPAPPPPLSMPEPLPPPPGPEEEAD